MRIPAALLTLLACCGCAAAAQHVPDAPPGPAAQPAARTPPAPSGHHVLWALRGRSNTVYLLGSVHFLQAAEQMPAAIEAAYEDAEALLMEIDMDDLDPLEMQQAALELGVLPAGESLQQQLGAQDYQKVAARARELGLDPATLDRFRPWLAAMTLVQLHMASMGLEAGAGVEQRLTQRAISDGKPIEGLETLRQQLSMLAALSPQQQQEFLLYSVEDSERMTREIDELLAAWRRGDTETLANLLAAGFEEYPDLYRPLTVDRNRKWIARIEALLDDREDYLVVVGSLHLVGKDSVVELLRRRGHPLEQR